MFNFAAHTSLTGHRVRGREDPTGLFCKEESLLWLKRSPDYWHWKRRRRASELHSSGVQAQDRALGKSGLNCAETFVNPCPALI